MFRSGGLCEAYLARAKLQSVSDIGPGVATGGVGAPAGGVVPAVSAAGGVGVDGDDDDVVLAEPAAPDVDAAAALGQGDVPFLRDPGLKPEPIIPVGEIPAGMILFFSKVGEKFFY